MAQGQAKIFQIVLDFPKDSLTKKVWVVSLWEARRVVQIFAARRFFCALTLTDK
jgi:hypothetical protein